MGKTRYAASGVDAEAEEAAVKGLLKWVNKTLAFRKTTGRNALETGFFGSVVDMGRGMGLAIATDGVGSKIIVAQMMNRYDTVGIDCVAMNVNDLICLGAEPVSMVDYIAVEKKPGADFLEQIGRGLYEGARQAGINIVGGEIAQLPDIIRGEHPDNAFDIAGTAVGLVPLDKVCTGRDVKKGDVLVSFKSSGIHSNGLTLARDVLFRRAGYAVDRHIRELGRTVGEELLEPTRIYVRTVMDIIRSGIRYKGFANITGDGLFNLTRFEAKVGFVIDELPEPHPVFRLIQEAGKIGTGEMYKVFNMGIGFCVVVSGSDAEKVIKAARAHGEDARVIGHAVSDRQKRIVLEKLHLVGAGGRFRKC